MERTRIVVGAQGHDTRRCTVELPYRPRVMAKQFAFKATRVVSISWVRTARTASPDARSGEKERLCSLVSSVAPDIWKMEGAGVGGTYASFGPILEHRLV